jgi:hypothetical protein
MSMQSSLMNLVAPFCKKVEKLPKCGNWQKCNYVTTISLHRTMKTPIYSSNSINLLNPLTRFYYSVLFLDFVSIVGVQILVYFSIIQHMFSYLYVFNLYECLVFKCKFGHTLGMPKDLRQLNLFL